MVGKNLAVGVCGMCVGVCWFVCVCSSDMFRHTSSMGLQLGMGLAPEAQEHIFEATPPKVKGHPEVKLLLQWPMATIFGMKDP